jgi:plasmid stabilization system protein ParE
MDYKVIFKDTFIADLEAIVRLIAARNPSAAQKLGEMIIQACESLCFFPERHPKVRQRPGVRRFTVKKYFKVFYRVKPETRTVELLRCWVADVSPILSSSLRAAVRSRIPACQPPRHFLNSSAWNRLIPS